MAKMPLVIDAQFHHVTREAAAKALAMGPPELRKKLENPSTAYRRMLDVDIAVSHMEECGVDMAVVLQPMFITSGLEFCKIFNDSLAGLVKQYPGKFIPCAHVPYLEGQPAIDELERAVSYLGLKSVCMLTSIQDVTLDDVRLKPLFKKASQLHVPVVVHPTTRAPLWGGIKYQMSGSVSREYEVSKAFVEVLMGVLPEFPDLNFVFAHYGGGVPFLLGRIMSWYDPEKTVGNEAPVGDVPRTIVEFEESRFKERFDKLFDRVYFDMAGTGGWLPALTQALQVIRPERLCLATDFPHELARPTDLKTYIAGVRALDIPEADKANILGGNIQRLFRL